MTTATVAAPARVAAVLATASTWTSARRKADNKPFFFIPSGSSDAVYMTAVDGCTCPAAQKSRTGDCKHQAAVRQHSVTVAPAPKARSRYELLFPACPCGDVADSHDGLCDRCASDREWQQRWARAV